MLFKCICLNFHNYQSNIHGEYKLKKNYNESSIKQIEEASSSIFQECNHKCELLFPYAIPEQRNQSQFTYKIIVIIDKFLCDKNFYK